MKARELQQCICDNTISINLLILLCKDKDHWLANQYVDCICDNNGYGHNYIDSLSEIDNSSAISMVIDPGEDLNILRVETFEEDYNYDLLENTVVICDKVSKKIEKKVSQFIVEMPKASERAQKAYIVKECPELSTDSINWLYESTKGNLTRLDNELSKINLFDKKLGDKIVLAMKNDPNTDLYDLSTFAFVDALIKGNRQILAEALAHTSLWDSDPMFILTLLLNKYKQIILVHGNSGLKAADMKLTPNQYNAIKYYYKGYDLDIIKNKLEFLSKINLRINLGEFDLSGKSFLDYLVNNLL